MRKLSPRFLALLLWLGPLLPGNTATRYVSLTGGHLPPFLSWSDAATNIQAAIDAADPGDEVLVADGIYDSGGKVMAGDLTNRVVVDKALTVRSLNGPLVTVIDGLSSGNGPAAVRCAWLTNNAVLRGFTLRGGGTRASGDAFTLQSGGGAWCSSTNAGLQHCLVVSNTAFAYGGGVYGGTHRYCWIARNSASGTTGIGGGAYSALLFHCTVTGNGAQNSGSGMSRSTATNSIIYFNTNLFTRLEDNYNNVFPVNLRNCCAKPLPSGLGNLGDDPRLLADRVHLDLASPCRGAGLATGTAEVDLDGQSWGNPPSIGCDEWGPEPIITRHPFLSLIPRPRALEWNVEAAGQPPFGVFWMKEGQWIPESLQPEAGTTASFILRAPGPGDAAGYQAIVSNAFGVVTSRVSRLTLHFVDSAAANPVPPFTNWLEAARTIQEAVDAAAPGSVVLVTNGTYDTGGKAMAGDLTNRVAVDKPLRIQSVNGHAVTTIVGGGSTNGPDGVRCVWLASGASLCGFTLQGGRTRAAGDISTLLSGGGAWCASTNDSIIANCWIAGNSSQDSGGGVYQGSVHNSAIVGNVSRSWGGGASRSWLNQCTVVSNSTVLTGIGGAVNCWVTNSIVYFNTGNYSGSSFDYSCTSPLPSGTGNTNADPQLLGPGLQLANTSPCRATARAGAAKGMDLYAQEWATPPSMGCAEWQAAPLVSPLRLQLAPDPPRFAISASLAGEPPESFCWLRNGVPLPSSDAVLSLQPTNLVLTDLRLLDGGEFQLMVSNRFGVSTSAVVQATIHYANAVAANPTPPFSTWATAATNLQDAIDAAPAGALVLVADGVYSTGGKPAPGENLTNRIAVTKPLIVQSVNGPETTIIQGAWDPATNGPAAIRCAWLTNGAALKGFTLRGGATRAGSINPSTQLNGGGAFGLSTNAVLEGCHLLGNAAFNSGGGACQLKLLNCILKANTACGAGSGSTSGYGGGAYGCLLQGCLVLDNSANRDGGGLAASHAVGCALSRNATGDYGYGGGAHQSTLVHCTVSRNQAASSGYGGGVSSSTLTNCIVYLNYGPEGTKASSTNHYNSTFVFSCSAPLPGGPGNLDANPGLLPDDIHLTSSSPCLAAGTPVSAPPADLDGQPWKPTPPMGCDEWHPEPFVVGLPELHVNSGPPVLQFTGLFLAGQEPFQLAWFKDGQPLDEGSHLQGTSATSLTIRGFSPDDAGNYQLVAHNDFGAHTGSVVRVRVHCVDASCPAPQFPYSNWFSAAATLQSAIDAAEPGALVLVTNGIYAAGGKAMGDGLTNRVALDKPLKVFSVNGPDQTIIRGAWDPATNGPAAIRCAWMTDGAQLIGFTLTGGATLSTGASSRDGGGVWAGSTNALVADCVISNNVSAYRGGGGCNAHFDRCIFWRNQAGFQGGGAHNSLVRNSLVVSNYAAAYGGGAYGGTLLNCTLQFNQTPLSAGGCGINSARAHNCVIMFNFDSRIPMGIEGNYASSVLSYCCTYPPSGEGSFASSPQWLDWWHLPSTSPCVGAGSPLYASGTDLEGEPWANPPSIGCDEFVEANLTGPLSLSLQLSPPVTTEDCQTVLYASLTGRVSRVAWDFGDGSVLTNVTRLTVNRTWAEPGLYPITCTAYNADHPEGVSATTNLLVLAFTTPTLTPGTFSNGTFSLLFPTQPAVYYDVYYATNLSPPSTWTFLRSVYGDGNPAFIVDPAPASPTRFYRVRLRQTPW